MAWEIAVAAGIGGFVGARVNYLIANPDQGGLFSSTGLVWYGGLIGGAIGVIAVALWRRIPLGLVANTAAPALALGYAVGRIGCQLSGDGDYGSASSLPWAMSYPDGEVPTTDLVHPTPLYETTSMLVVFWLLWRLRARFDGPWALFGVWCILGGIERFLVEFIRRNDAVVAGLTTAQLISLAPGRARRRDPRRGAQTHPPNRRCCVTNRQNPACCRDAAAGPEVASEPDHDRGRSADARLRPARAQGDPGRPRHDLRDDAARRARDPARVLRHRAPGGRVGRVADERGPGHRSLARDDRGRRARQPRARRRGMGRQLRLMARGDEPARSTGGQEDLASELLEGAA